jgi:hypothetical protein
MRQQTRTQQSLKTGKVLTSSLRKSIKALTKSSTPARITATRIQNLLSTFRARVKQLAKASNSRKGH